MDVDLRSFLVVRGVPESNVFVNLNNFGESISAPNRAGHVNLYILTHF